MRCISKFALARLAGGNEEDIEPQRAACDGRGLAFEPSFTGLQASDLLRGLFVRPPTCPVCMVLFDQAQEQRTTLAASPRT